MKTPKRALGDLGEGIAVKWLEDRGFTILERNYLRPWGELDIVAEKVSRLHFVEVKSVTRESWLRPEENVHKAKIARLYRAIQTYVSDHKMKHRDWQLDLVTVKINFDTKKAKIEYFENVLL